MERFRAYIQRHKLIARVLGLGVIVFFNCFGFPIINLNREWPLTLTATKIHVVQGGALASGGIQAGLLLPKKLNFILLATSFAVGFGLRCRYLPELGEVSNSYNFTHPNTLLHVGGSSLTGPTWVYDVIML